MKFSEHKWLEINDNQYLKLKNDLNLSQVPCITVTINKPNKTYVNIFCDDENLLIDFAEINGGISNFKRDSLSCLDLYVIRGKDANVLGKIGVQPKNYQEDNIGIVNKKNKATIFFGGSNYGLIKSVVFGLASYWNLQAGYFPIHGAFIKINNKGIVLFGGQKVGKTTTLGYILKDQRQKNKFKFATDDWLIAYTEGQDLHGLSMENNFSFLKKESALYEKQSLKVKESLTSINKLYIPKSVMFGREQIFDWGRIDMIVQLTRTSTSAYPKTLTINEVLKDIIQTSYHCPLLENDLDTVHSFWLKALKNVPHIYTMNIFAGNTSVNEKVDFLFSKLNIKTN